MPINNFTMPYPDFKLYEVIDPEQHDTNNAILVNKINELINQINSFANGQTIDSMSSNIVQTPAIEPFPESSLTVLLESLIQKLRSVADGNSGADFVQATTIPGLVSTNVQGILEEIKTLIDSIGDMSEGSLTDLGVHKSSGDHDTRYYRKDELLGVLNEVYYTWQELSNEGVLDTRYYTETELDPRFPDGTIDLTTPASLDERYVMKGADTGDIRTDETKPLVVEVRDGSDPASPEVGQIWFRRDL